MTDVSDALARAPFAYTLEDDNRTPRPLALPVAAEDWPELGRWLIRWGEGAGKLARDTVGLVTVSTVFMCCNLSSNPNGPPLLWETALVDANGDLLAVVDRYATWEEARAGHDEAVQRVTNGDRP